MIWSARGVRVGISSISRTQCFWFTTLTCPEVRLCVFWNPARLLSQIWCSGKEAIALPCHDSFKASFSKFQGPPAVFLLWSEIEAMSLGAALVGHAWCL